MITEYTETWLNPPPFQKWYIILNVETSELLEDLQFQTDNTFAMNIAEGIKYITFDSKEEGKTYIEDNDLITREYINRNIEYSPSEEE
jgi:hypothetical protein